MTSRKNLPENDSKERDVDQCYWEAAQEYIWAPFDRIVPLFHENTTVTVAAASYEFLKSTYPDIVMSLSDNTNRKKLRGAGDEGDESEHPAYVALLNAVHAYRYRLRIYNQKPKPNFNKELVKIQDSARKLQSLLKRAAPAVQFQLNTNFHLTGTDSRLTVPDVEIAIEQLIAASGGSFREEKCRGARPKRHVLGLAHALISLWEQSGNEFKWRFDTARGRSGGASKKEFVSKGAEFVWILMSQIDPNLTKSEVTKALKELSHRRSALSEN